ncbi:MAG TPA: ATP-binding protein, partial [Coleofasciculaceae cyanobacterium]
FTTQGSVQLQIKEVLTDQVAIAVTDTGMGMAQIDQAHIFKEFWQSDQTLTRNHGGTGLGLAITDALVKAMQGRIAVKSQVGVGTTFQIHLPRCVAAGSSPSKA